MDVTGIASSGSSMGAAEIFVKMHFSVLEKGLEAAESQGETIQKMIDAASIQAPPASGQILDTYA